MISADFWEDGRFDDWPVEKVLCFMGLWGAASDYGVLPTNDAGRLRNQIFPGRPSVTREDVSRWCQEMEHEGLLLPFDDGGKHWWYVKSFLERQPLRRRSACGRPIPPDNVRHCPQMSALNDRTTERRTIERRTTITPISPSGEADNDGDGGCCDPDPNLEAVCQTYETEIGLLTKTIGDDIKAELHAGTPVEWIQRAIQGAARQNKRKWSYVMGILSAWRAQGCMDTGPPHQGKNHTQATVTESDTRPLHEVLKKP